MDSKRRAAPPLKTAPRQTGLGSTREYREKKFGYNGELFTLQESKVKPIQDKVFRAVENVSKQRRFDLVFDKAGEVTWLYTNAIYDLSNDVLEELGFKQDNN